MSKSNNSDMLNAISHCHQYLAIVNGLRDTLEIYELPAVLLFRKYNLGSIVKKHLKEVEKLKVSSQLLVISQLEWEPILPRSKSTKLGLVVDNFSLLLIVDIRSFDMDPIFVQQSSVDGIEKILWIPPLVEEAERERNSSNELGAYQNAKQIVLITKGYLELKLYSLDCTSMLLKIIKPVEDSFLIRPNSNYSIWSVCGQSLNGKGTVLFHFFNDGSASFIFHTFQITDSNISNSNLQWSPSGKWLCFFDQEETLSGFKLRIFNSLGLYSKQTIGQTFKGKPIVSVDWLINGVHGEFGENAQKLSTGSTLYLNKWVALSGIDYLLVVSIMKIDEMEMILFSSESFRVVNRNVVNLSKLSQNWKISKAGEVQNLTMASNTSSTRKNSLVDFNSRGSYFYILFLNFVLIYQIEVDLNFNSFNFKLVTSIDFILPVIDINFQITAHSKLLIVAEKGVFSLDLENAFLERLYMCSTSVYDAYLLLDGYIAVLKEDYLKEGVNSWDIQKITLEEDRDFFLRNESLSWRKTLLGLPRRQSLNSGSKRMYQSKGETASVNSSIEEVTDTFKIHKRQKSK